MIWLTVLGVLVVIGYYFVLSRRPANILSTPALEIKLISVDQARALVDDLLAKGEMLFAEANDSADSLSAELGPITRDFFARYGSLWTQRRAFSLIASEIRPSEYARGYLSIGHSEDWDIVQKPGSDQVFVIEGSEANESEMDAQFPSVYHLVLDEAQQI